MPAYAVAHLRNVRMGREIAEYLERIDATLAPYGGLFRIHGGRLRVVEGAWAGDLIMIEFPSLADAEAWYASSAYQAILPLRTGNADGDTLLIDGVEPDHRATDILRAATPPSAAPA